MRTMPVTREAERGVMISSASVAFFQDVRGAAGKIRRMEFERTDFVSVPVEDMDRAKAFYRDMLGLHSPNWDEGWPEIETGNVSLYLVDPTVMGTSSRPTGAVALRVRTSPRPSASSKSAAWSSPGSTTPASARWPSSATPRATR